MTLPDTLQLPFPDIKGDAKTSSIEPLSMTQVVLMIIDGDDLCVRTPLSASYHETHLHVLKV